MILKAAFYAWAKRSAGPDPDRERMALVEEAFQRSHQTYGYRRIAIWLGAHKNIRINSKADLRLMNKLELRPLARRGRDYLAVITDLFDGFIVAHHLSQDNSIGLVTRTLPLAKQKERNVKGLLLHSDQGSQYRSDH